MQNYMKTIISALQTWINKRFAAFEISEVELLEILSELDAVQPLASNSGAIYTNNSGQVYIL